MGFRMTRFFVRMAVVLMVLFTVALVLIRTQPYDNSRMEALESLMLGCRSACFMGIYPKQTTVEEAITILKAHVWVEDVKPAYMDKASAYWGEISWKWKLNTPLFGLLPSGESFTGRVRIVGGVVEEIHVSTNVELYQLWLDWKAPPYFRLDTLATFTTLEPFPPVLYHLDYPASGISAKGIKICPNLVDIWDTQLSFSMVRPKDFSLSRSASMNARFRFHYQLTQLEVHYC